MFIEIFLFELKYRISRPATWIYFLVLFLIAYLTLCTQAGAISSIQISVGGTRSGKVFANAPFNINGLISGLTFIGVLIISAIVGNPVYRDFEHDTHSLFYTKP